MTKGTLIKEGTKITGTFLAGFLSVFRALPVAGRQKGLKKYFIIPFLLNLVLLSSLAYLMIREVHLLIGTGVTGSGWYWDILRLTLKIILYSGSIFVLLLAYQFIGGIITAPFNDFLSQRVEENLTGEKFDDSLSLKRLLSDAARIVSSTLKLLFLLIGINILLLFLNLVPVVGNVAYAVLSFFATSFFFGFQFFDFPLERRRLRFNEKFLIIRKFKFMAAGLGAGFFLLTFIPVVGFLGLNLGTIGGTMLFIDHIKPALARGTGNESNDR